MRGTVKIGDDAIRGEDTDVLEAAAVAVLRELRRRSLSVMDRCIDTDNTKGEGVYRKRWEGFAAAVTVVEGLPKRETWME